MKLRQLRQPPLLNPVSEIDLGWMRLTSNELRRLDEYAEKLRNGDDKKASGLSLAQEHAILAELGYRVSSDEGDRKILLSSLEALRQPKPGDRFFQLAYYIDLSGLDPPSVQEDIIYLKDSLERERKSGEGRKMLWAHHLLRHFGSPQEVTAEDNKTINRTLSRFRRDSPLPWMLTIGEAIAETLYLMSELGLEYQVTHRDEKAMEAEAQFLRRGKPGLEDGILKLMTLAYYGRKLLRPGGGYDEPPIPTLKRFRG